MFDTRSATRDGRRTRDPRRTRARRSLRVPDELSRQIHPQADFYVVVRGDSMSSVGYRTGDIIVSGSTKK